MTWFLFMLSAAFFFALGNTLDSILIKRYKQSAMLMYWMSSFFRFSSICWVPLVVDVSSSWIPVFFITALLFIVAVLVYFYILKHIDVSIINAAWAIKSIMLSVVGFMLFHEQWTLLQTVGSIAVIGGILVLSYKHQHQSLLKTFLLFCLLAILIVPDDTMRKLAVQSGDSPWTVVFWMTTAGALYVQIIAVCVPSMRRSIAALPQTVDRYFPLISAVSGTASIVAFYCVIKAFETGTISLASIVGNVQPFLTILIAWLFARFLPTYAPKELLTAQSVRIKCASFALVFGGLVLLVVG